MLPAVNAAGGRACDFYETLTRATGSFVRRSRLRGHRRSVLDPTEPERTMLDVAYITGTLAFFALMLLYIKFCVSLAGKSDVEEPRHDG
jgi:hypothetical protein